MLDLRRRGHRPLCVYVYAPNRRARDFYRRAGFEPDGGTRLDEADGAGVAEIRLVGRGLPPADGRRAVGAPGQDRAG
ncbi:hypothetical protein Adi01nite_57000 [Amorphoplanes digitatis]|nr:hypothetical protein GCM10020092_070230 [Actinoplanes digitatis]GID96288.1 hypothetical protein Adi01nite_57000 [Actinoplanes digitatis]